MAIPAGEYARHVSKRLSHPLASMVPAGEYGHSRWRVCPSREQAAESPAGEYGSRRRVWPYPLASMIPASDNAITASDNRRPSSRQRQDHGPAPRCELTNSASAPATTYLATAAMYARGSTRPNNLQHSSPVPSSVIAPPPSSTPTGSLHRHLRRPSPARWLRTVEPREQDARAGHVRPREPIDTNPPVLPSLSSLAQRPQRSMCARARIERVSAPGDSTVCRAGPNKRTIGSFPQRNMAQTPEPRHLPPIRLMVSEDKI
ncbi:uncharacterized protein J3D65DRAFT_309334 [Phyllosticta citribraziliensis]|uniref:Uncharacterized protein n=1 Tax=Phyllosticta citribraziliensis TaxID=989973 RepID=A0ABR1LY08_9PEZI